MVEGGGGGAEKVDGRADERDEGQCNELVWRREVNEPKRMMGQKGLHSMCKVDDAFSDGLEWWVGVYDSAWRRLRGVDTAKHGRDQRKEIHTQAPMRMASFKMESTSKCSTAIPHLLDLRLRSLVMLCSRFRQHFDPFLFSSFATKLISTSITLELQDFIDVLWHTPDYAHTFRSIDGRKGGNLVRGGVHGPGFEKDTQILCAFP